MALIGLVALFVLWNVVAGFKAVKRDGTADTKGTTTFVVRLVVSISALIALAVAQTLGLIDLEA